MKSPVVLVTAALTVAILLSASFLIVTGTRGENAFRPLVDNPAGKITPASPTTK
jgi:aldose sugar dehydrogenase